MALEQDINITNTLEPYDFGNVFNNTSGFEEIHSEMSMTILGDSLR